MSSFQTLDETASSSSESTSAGSAVSSTSVAAPSAGEGGDVVKPKGEAGKSEISGAVFNLANAVRAMGCCGRALPRPMEAHSCFFLPPNTPLLHAALPLLLLQIIGAGVGGMPYALKLAGFYGGIFLIFLVAYCSDYTLRLLITLSRKTKSKYYEDLMTTQFGHRGYLFVVGAMGIFAYGAMVAYLMGIGACLRALLPLAAPLRSPPAARPLLVPARPAMPAPSPHPQPPATTWPL